MDACRLTAMTKALDAIDKHMIALLRANARLPLVALAKAIGLSRSATQERLKRLERQNVIAGYTVQLGNLRDRATRAWLSVRFMDGYRCADIVPHLLRQSEVRLCHSLAGDVDLLILVEADSMSGISEVRETIAAIEGVADVKSAPVLTEHFDVTQNAAARAAKE